MLITKKKQISRLYNMLLRIMICITVCVKCIVIIVAVVTNIVSYFLGDRKVISDVRMPYCFQF